MTHDRAFDRRSWLRTTACGFGGLAWSALATEARGNPLGSAARVAQPHFPPRAKRVIFLFMQGGVSHVDSFDYKPRLIQDDGQKMSFVDARKKANTGDGSSQQRVMKPLWEFQQHGECGRWGSALFPHTAALADDLCFLHGMHTEGVAHGPATLFLHCGSTTFIRPSIGSWISYGLGSENANLPDFVSLSPSSGNGGARNYGAAFLPTRYQGTAIGRAGAPASEARINNLENTFLDTGAQQEQLQLLQRLNQAQRLRYPHDFELEAAMGAFDLAWRIEQSAPDVLNIEQESATTKKLYGIGEQPTDDYGRKCLMARRLCEAGVRFVQVTYGDNTANPAWDQHSNMPKHADHALAVDKPIAGLLMDLKQRGLLEDTIVWWGGEFGRTPYAQANGTGRDHNPDGFTVWVAGGGFKPGFAFGETDEFGQFAIAGKTHVHDLHATILHQLGLDHERLTYRYAGRDFRLTDVYGRVIREVI